MEKFFGFGAASSASYVPGSSQTSKTLEKKRHSSTSSMFYFISFSSPSSSSFGIEKFALAFDIDPSSHRPLPESFLLSHHLCISFIYFSHKVSERASDYVSVAVNVIFNFELHLVLLHNLIQFYFLSISVHSLLH